MNKILITGSSGFIGSNLLDFYISRGYDVLNIDKVAPRMKEYLSQWKMINILDYKAFEKEVLNFKPDYIIHLAARTDLNGVKLIDYESNTIGTENLIRILSKVPTIKRVLFTSSMLVCKPGYIPSNVIDYAPSTTYGESKVLMENIIRNSKHNYEWAIIRPTSIWGPWFGEPYRKFFEIIMKKRYYHIQGKSCIKTYGYVGNLIYQIDSILNAPTDKVQGNVFYLGDYNPTDIHEWSKEISNHLGIKIKSIPYSLFKFTAIGGDILRIFNLKFPMNSFRLNNMITNNVVDTSNTRDIAPNLPFTRIDGIRITLDWINKFSI